MSLRLNLAALGFYAFGLGVWFALIARFGLLDLVLGVLVVGSAWALFQRISEPKLNIAPGRWRPWVFGVGRFLFLRVSLEVVRSTFRVFTKVLRPRLELNPAIVAVHVPDATRAGLILLAYSISLTPGEQIVDIDEAANILYVHGLDVPDPEALRARIRNTHERYLKEATRW